MFKVSLQDDVFRKTMPMANSTQVKDKGFSDKLSSAVAKVNKGLIEADHAVGKVITGKMSISEGAMKMQEASLSLKMLIKVKSKAIEAYKEIIRMPV